MIVKIRKCCCSLATLVKTICYIFIVLHFCVGLSGAFWFLLSSNDVSTNYVSVAEKEDGEINGFEDFDVGKNINADDHTFRNIVVLVIILIFTFVGSFVNLMVVCSLRLRKRSLILPWLVYHTFLILGKKINYRFFSP